MGGVEGIPAQELLRSGYSVCKTTFCNFSSPVLVQITVGTKDKGRERDSTSKCAQCKTVGAVLRLWKMCRAVVTHPF